MKLMKVVKITYEQYIGIYQRCSSPDKPFYECVAEILTRLDELERENKKLREKIKTLLGLKL